MKTFEVLYETRKPGAIGIFEHSRYVVQAETPAEAASIAFDLAHDAGLETRFGGEASTWEVTP